MNCFLCGQSNPDTNCYCGQCGAVLDADAQALRAQILGVVRKEFEDEEYAAIKIADKAEERLWRLGKVLGSALAIFLAGLASFGISTYREARSSINVAVLKATNNINDISEVARRAVVKKSNQTISEMQQQGQTVSNKIASENSRAAKAGTSLGRLEQELKDQQTRLAALDRIRSEQPDTPIGNINSGLFTSNVNGPVSLGNDSWSALTSSLLNSGTPQSQGLVYPYKEGMSGSGIVKIQDRLSALGCYSGKSTGTFDAATAAAVAAFVSVNGTPPLDSYVPLANFGDPYLPTPLINDQTPGTVDYNLWDELFSDTAKKCP